MRILAAIVTHNRSQLLCRCLDNLSSQSRPPDHLLVINNGSTDDTLSLLHRRHIDFISQANVGSAGGWFTAIDYCIQHSFDAVWLMDDDGFPARDALEILERELTAGVSCVSSIVLRLDSKQRFVFPFPILSESYRPVLFRFPRKVSTLPSLQQLSPSGKYPYAHFFNGALISSEAIRAVGNVNPDYFIFGDEVDYFYRLRRFGQVLSILSAHHFHPDVTGRPYSPQKIFYYIRNTLILNRLYMDYPLLRNLLAILIVFLRTVRRNGLSFAIPYFIGSQRSVFLRAISDGLNARLGSSFHD